MAKRAPTPKLLTIKAALPKLAALGVTAEGGAPVSGRTVRRWLAKEGAPHVKGSGKTSPSMVDPAALAEWWKARGLVAAKGRPTAVEQLLRDSPSPARGNATSSPTTRREGRTRQRVMFQLDDDERAALQAMGADPDVLEQLSPDIVRMMAAQAKARGDLARAEKQELANSQKRGELHAVESCTRSQVENVHTVRSRMRAAPGRIVQALSRVGVKPGILKRVREVVAEELHQVQLDFHAEAKA